ncbi:hypothetical protein ACWD00_09270 [Streptomyces viridiviolaceus]
MFDTDHPGRQVEATKAADPPGARELQAEVGRWCAKRSRGGVDERLVARRLRWEEARRQVQHVIATETGPHGAT